MQGLDQFIDGFFADEYSRVEHRWPPELLDRLSSMPGMPHFSSPFPERL
jgi:hypothetical protein